MLIGKISANFSLSYIVEMAIHLKNEYLMLSYKIILLKFLELDGGVVQRTDSALRIFMKLSKIF